MSGKHRHFPESTDPTVPFVHGQEAICYRCGKRIVFIGGYAFRQDYWRLSGKKVKVPA